jgi:transcription elongation factor SPT5
MSKKFLRPPPQAFDSDSEDDEEEEIVDQRRPVDDVNLSSDDDDDEEEDEEDTRARSSSSNKKRKAGGNAPRNKRIKASSFVELEAEDDDDDEDEDGRGRFGKKTDLDGEQMDAEAREIMVRQDRRRAQAGFHFNERSVEEMAEEIETRHRMQRRTVDRSSILDRPRPSVAAAVAAPVHRRHEDEAVEGGPEVYSAVAQQSLLPSVKDPSFWMVSCSTGKEQELVYQIMNKCVAYARQNKPLGITGAIAAQSKGKIYIESFSEPAVMEAVEGVRGLLTYSMRLVPIGDMTTVMTVTSKKKPVKQNEWVRMTRGHYKGDLALVKEVKESGLKCIVQCVPRLDLTLLELPPEEAKIRRKTVRPPQKFFNSQEIAALGKHSTGRQPFRALGIMCDYFEGNYYQDGYLLKEMTVGSMVKPCTDEDPPTLDELQRFQRPKSKDEDHDDDDNQGSKLATSLLDELANLQQSTGFGKTSSGGGLQIGDTVEVIEGDLIGMRGKLVSQDGSTVKVKPMGTNVDLGGTDEVEFLSSQVRKHIPIGAHVKVTDGRYANETGVVVAVEAISSGDNDSTAVVLTDITNKEITVRTSQLRETTEITTNQDKLAGYELYDLVVITGGGSANEVGVIVRVGREDFTIVNNHGIAREARPEELRGKLNTPSSRAVALDVQGNQLRVGDTVNVAEGPHKGKTATIKRMNRSQLFLHSQTRSDHAGIFVVRSRSCVLAGSSQNRGTDGGAFSNQQSQNSRGPAGGRGKRDDAMIGKTVRIQAGQWKGYIGTVADTTATHVQVELHSRLKKVMVTHERISVIGDKFGSTEDPTRVVAEPAPGLAPTTPFVSAGQTPMHGGATPMHGGNLEAEESDDVWRPGGTVDQEANEAIQDDGWGSTSAFGADENDDWGSTNNQSDWGAATATKKEEGASASKQESKAALAAVNQDHQGEMEADIAETVEMPAWFMERVCVEVKSTEKQGVIKQTHAKNAVVEFEDGSTTNVGVNDLARIAPSELDTVLVTDGNEIGLEGSLVCIDGTDAILKVANDDFKIVEVGFLAKVQAQA